MTPVFDQHQVHAWLSTLFDGCNGFINIVSTGNWAGKSFRTVDQAVSYVQLLDKRQPQGIYVRATTLQQQLPPSQRGGAVHTQEFVGFWADLDIAGKGHKWHVCDTTPCSNADQPGHKTNTIPLLPDEAACLELIERSGLPTPTEWIHSGGGMYPWWLTTTPHTPASNQQLDELGQASARWQRVIELTAAEMGYHYGAGVGDLSRVLRIPGTVNRKVEDSPKMCQWRMDLSTSTPYTPEDLHSHLKRAEKRFETVTIPTSSPGYTPTPTSLPGNRPGDAFNAATTWPQLLEAEGATLFRQLGNGYAEWTRPGKDRRDGMSATTGYKGADVLKVFTDSWPGLRQDVTYDRFGFYAAIKHNGNIREAAKALAALGYGEPNHQTITEWTPPQTLQPDTEPAPTPRVKPTYTMTDSGFADRLAIRHGNEWRYVATRQRFGWLRWNGTIWQVDKKGAAVNLVDELAQQEYARTFEEEDESKREKLQKALKPMLSNSKQVGTAAIFARRPGIATDADQLDAHPTKITCPNGVLDLATMEFGAHDHTLLATKQLGVAYDPAATAPRWQQFLEEVLPCPEVRDYLQRAIGYTLLGRPDHKAIFMLHGPSHTGKSQVINVLAGVFGSFAESAKEQTFRVNDSANGPTPGLHKLRGARLVTASESTEGVRLDEALIKQLTGGDVISSRPLYGDEESWRPAFSIWLATNHLPKFSSDDNAIWRRVKPIHFNVVFGTEGREEVFDIGHKLLQQEGPGILNWILAGLVRYRQHGLEEPELLVQGVADYRAESDPVARFISNAVTEGNLLIGNDEKIEAKLLYAHFQAWCTDEGERWPLPANRFGRRLIRLGYQKTKDSSGTKRMWRGLGPAKDAWLISGNRLPE